MKKLLSSLLFISLALVSTCVQAPRTLVLIHSNDTHGVYKPYSIKTNAGERLIGGMETVSHYLNRLKAAEENLILIEKGDLLTGTPAADIKYRDVIGGAMVEFLNKLGYDVWCLGNHDFDRGQDNALGLARLAQFPTLMANIVYKENRASFPVAPYHILEKNGLRIGIVAVMEENFLQEVLPDKIEGLDVLPIVPTLLSIIPELEKATDLVVVLVHGRFPEGVKAAKNVRGIDVVLVASEDGKFENVNGVLVQSTYGHQRTLGYLKLHVKNDRVLDYEQKLVWLWADVSLDPSSDISDLITEVEIVIGREYAEVIGHAMNDHTREECPVENVLGDWITDVMRWETGAQVAFYNSQGIRADIKAGPVTKADVFLVMPFNNTLKKCDFTGKQIRDILEYDVERDWDRLQVSGLKYRFHPKEKKPFGERIDLIEIDGQILVKNGQILMSEKIFTVVCNDYLAEQAKKKYFGFEANGSEIFGSSLYGILVKWLKDHKTLDYRCQGRIAKILE